MIGFVIPYKSSFRRWLSALWLAIAAGTAQATLVDFESFVDNFALSNEVPGLTVSGGTVVTAGISLNEIDFPPTSGLNVLAAPSGSLTLGFLEPITDFSAYLTFAEPLAFSAFGVGGNLLLSFGSPVGSNLGSTALINFNMPGVTLLVIAGQGGSGFTLDDLSFNSVTPTPTPIPEPSTLSLLAVALATALIRRRRGEQVASR